MSTEHFEVKRGNRYSLGISLNNHCSTMTIVSPLPLSLSHGQQVNVAQLASINERKFMFNPFLFS